MSTSPSAEFARDAALRRCISCGPGEFAGAHWGRAPLLSRAGQLPGSTGGFSDLFSAADVDALTSLHALRTPFLRMAKNGDVLANTTFTRSGGAGATIADQAADDKILSALADGATLVLQALHRSWPPLVRFGSRLSDDLGHPVQINAYVTPPQNRGFAPHYDVHDVFVLQVAGTKRWIIHEPVLRDPLERHPWQQRSAAVAAQAASTPLIDTVLEPGDALYLPRGTIHAATAQGETSIHLTVGVHPITRYHLVRQLLDLVADDEQLRTSLPMGVDLSDPAELAEPLARTLHALADRLARTDDAALARGVGLDLMQRTRPEPIGPLAQLDAARALTQHTVLRWRSGLRARIIDTDGSVSITLLDRTVPVHSAGADAVKTLLSGAALRVAELGGTEVERIELARRLLRAGVVVVTHP